MGAVELFTGVSSILVRFFAWVFLRVIPGERVDMNEGFVTSILIFSAVQSSLRLLLAHFLSSPHLTSPWPPAWFCSGRPLPFS